MRHAKALTTSTSLTIWFIVVITIWSEMSKSFKAFLAGITGHHWVTKGILSLALFFIAYYILSKATKNTQEKAIGIFTVVWSTVLGGFIILIFYIWHFLA